MLSYPFFSRRYRLQAWSFLLLVRLRGICSWCISIPFERLRIWYSQYDCGHLTSMKNESGAFTSFLSLCIPCSCSGSWLSRSISIFSLSNKVLIYLIIPM